MEHLTRSLLVWVLLAGEGVSVQGQTEGPNLRIVTIEEPPYMFVSNTTPPRYSGYLPDLINLLAYKADFEFDFYLSPDGKYGSTGPDGQWNGMIGELATKQADLAAAPLTITSTRHRVVDFLMPFQHGGLVLVTKVPEENQSYSFSIFQPFSVGLWVLLVVITIVVAVMLSFIKRFDPYERRRGADGQTPRFSWCKSFWFVFSTVSWQGYERGPRSGAAQTLAVFWFSFVMLTVLMYLSGLSNLLWWRDVAGGFPRETFGSLDELVRADFKDVKIGCLQGGSTFSYFQYSKAAVYQRVYEYWRTEDGQSQLVDTIDEGIERARAGNYVFVMESMSAEYFMDRAPCDLTTIGREFAQRSYGMAMPVNAELYSRLHLGILELQESGELDKLEQKWWYARGECPYRPQIGDMSTSSGLSMKFQQPKSIDVGTFWEGLVCIIAGLVITALVAVVEILYNRRNQTKVQRQMSGDSSAVIIGDRPN